jgi:hypothetical protein
MITLNVIISTAFSQYPIIIALQINGFLVLQDIVINFRRFTHPYIAVVNECTHTSYIMSKPQRQEMLK